MCKLKCIHSTSSRYVDLPVMFPSPIYPIANDISKCVASALIVYHAIDFYLRCALFDFVPCIVRFVDFVCTAWTTFQRQMSCSNNNHHKLKMAHGNPKTPGLIYSLHFPMSHLANVQGISHEFRLVPR